MAVEKGKHHCRCFWFIAVLGLLWYSAILCRKEATNLPLGIFGCWSCASTNRAHSVTHFLSLRYYIRSERIVSQMIVSDIPGVAELATERY